MARFENWERFFQNFYLKYIKNEDPIIEFN